MASWNGCELEAPLPAVARSDSHYSIEGNMKAQWCVCSTGGEDAAGRPYGYGDGYSKSPWRLYGLADTREDAEAMLAEFKSGPLLSEPRIAGSRKMYPLLEVREYDPTRLRVRAIARGGRL